MNRIFSYHTWLCCLFVIALLQAACQPKRTEPAAVSVKTTIIDDLELRYSPGHLPVETLLTLQIKPTATMTQLQGRIEGISNYMGVIPLRFSQQSDGVWSTQFMLGACTEPDMLWRLTLSYQTADGQFIQLEDQFTSSWTK